MAAWPETLPPPVLDGYGGEPQESVHRTDFASGPARQRQLYTAVPDTQTITWKFKPAEMAIFRAFWRDELHNGADWFTMNANLGEGILQHEVRFVSGRFNYSVLPGMNFQVSAQCDVRATNA